MKRILLISFMLMSALFSEAWAQRTVSGQVTSPEGEGLPGVTVRVKGTSTGVNTDFDGAYRLTVPEGENTLVFSFVGYETVEEPVGSRSVINVTLREDVRQLQEVIVTGTSTALEKEKVPFAVGSIGEELIQQVPATSATGALQGKISGVRMVQGSSPGDAPSIRLRGSTSLTGSQNPLIIIDGVITEGSLADINAEDIQKIEVIKGAAASSIYGSRAGNGVVQVITKRGKGLKAGKPRVTFRNEFGRNQTIAEFPFARRHPYLLNASGGYDRTENGALQLDPDGLVDNPFPGGFSNPQEKFFDPGFFYTNYLSLASNSEKTNFMASFQNFNQSGVIEGNEGYQRRNFRLNLDHSVSDKITFTFSGLYGQSQEDVIPEGQGGPFFDLAFIPPDADLLAPNEEDGSPYNYDAAFDLGTNVINPLYVLNNNDRDRNRNRFLGNLELKYDVTDWLTLSSQYSLDRLQSRFSNFYPKGYLVNSPSGTINGRLTESNTDRSLQTVWFNAIFDKKFGDLNTIFRTTYLFEDDDYEWFSARAQGFPSKGIRNIGAGQSDQLAVNQITEERKAENYFFAATLDYQSKLILDGLYRRDGSSLFGADNRYRGFYRASMAYRLTQDIQIPGIQEFKLRASYGTAGQRPSEFAAQYEVVDVAAGNVQFETLGNSQLKPSISAEREFGVNIEFLDRFTFEANYAKTVTTDQIIRVPLSQNAGGFVAQWRNAGTLEGTAWEASLGANLVRSRDFNWNVNVLFDRIRQRVTAFDAPDVRVGPGANTDGQIFYIREGETFGVMYGNKFATSLDQLPAEANRSDYTINSDGYVIPVGTEGTADERPVKIVDEEGNKLFVIGDVNPDFNMAFNTNVSWKNLNLYALVDWKKGGDVYNLSRQWTYRDYRHADLVGSGKHLDYYAAADGLYNVNQAASEFVEDGSYVKLREVNLSYRFGKEMLGGLGAVISELKVGLVGRNLLMFTNYSGVDPEVSSPSADPEANYDRSNFAFDSFGYPSFRTYSGSLQIIF